MKIINIFLSFLFLTLISCSKKEEISYDWKESYANVNSQIEMDVTVMESGFFSAIDSGAEQHINLFQVTDDADNDKYIAISKVFYENGADYNALKIISDKYNISQQEFEIVRRLTTLFMFFQRNKLILQNDTLQLGELRKGALLNLEKPDLSYSGRDRRSSLSLNEDCIWATAGTIITALAPLTPISGPFAVGIWAAGAIIAARSMYKDCR